MKFHEGFLVWVFSDKKMTASVAMLDMQECENQSLSEFNLNIGVSFPEKGMYYETMKSIKKKVFKFTRGNDKYFSSALKIS